MKKMTMWILALLLVCNVVLLSGCGGKAEDPGEPPAEVINPGQSSEDMVPDSNLSEESSTGNAEDSGEVLENAISVRIGRDGTKE